VTGPSPRRVLAAAATVALLGAPGACGEGDDGGPAIADPQFPLSVREIRFGGRAAFLEPPEPTTPDAVLTLRRTAGPVFEDREVGAVPRWSFTLRPTVPELESLEIGFSGPIGDDRYIRFGRRSLEVTSSTSAPTQAFDFELDLGGIGVGALRMSFVATARDDRDTPTIDDDILWVSNAVDAQITLTGEMAPPSVAIPSAYDTEPACGSDDRFALDVLNGRCFVHREGERLDCERCDGPGVDRCLTRFCGPRR